jgi:outer membrane protein assembly factor BamB
MGQGGASLGSDDWIHRARSATAPLVTSNCIVQVRWLIAIGLLASATMAPVIASPFSSEVSASTKATDIFHEPWAIASHGSHVWVVNFAKNIVELDADTGSVIRVINAKADGHLEPETISYHAAHLWVISGVSVVELNASNGALIRVIRARRFDFDFDSGPIDFSGRNAWVLNAHNESVTEFDAGNGALIRVVHLHIKALANSTPDNYYSPLDMAISGSRVLVSDVTVTGNQIIELSTLSGSIIRVLKAGDGPWRNTRGILAADGHHVWITGDGYGKLVDLDSRSGSVIRVIKRKVPVIGFVTAMIVDGSNLWITNDDNTGSVTELNANTGSLIRAMKDTYYRLTKAQVGHSHGGAAFTAVAATASRVWVVNQFGSVLEWNSFNGSFIRNIK